jgi:urea transport system substrate-binding protein
MYLGNSLWCKFVAIVMGLLLLLPVLAACGGGKESPAPTATAPPTLTAAPIASPTQTAAPTTIPTTMPAPTATPAATPTPVPSGPVKIGAISAWSGPFAVAGIVYGDPIIKLVEWQVKQMGGILGGREVKVVKYDNRGSVAEAGAGATKLIKEDQVSALVWGGVSGAECEAVSAIAEESHTFYAAFGDLKGLPEKKFTVCCTYSDADLAVPIIKLVTKVLNAKTVAYLTTDLSDGRWRVEIYKSKLEPAGVKTVYEEYVPVDASDFTSYLTKIKYVAPDVLVLDSPRSEVPLTVAKQIMDLGGWGDIQVVVAISSGEASKSKPGAQGWYLGGLWVPGLPYPGAVKFETDYKTLNNGKLPDENMVYNYVSLWTAINALELAGTDDSAKAAEASRSGKLEWDTPIGRARFTLDHPGYPGLLPLMTHVEGGQKVYVNLPE